MVGRVSGDQIRGVQAPEVEEIHQQGFVEGQVVSQDLERPSRSDGGMRKSETNLEGQSRQAGLDRQLLEGRADAIFKACEGVGTDENTIFRSLSGLNQKERTELNEIYRQKFGMSLEDQLRSEMSGPELDKALGLLNGNGASPVKASIESRADSIRKACEGVGTDEQTIFRNLSGMTAEERQQLNEVYKQKFGISLEDQLRSEMSGPELQKGLDLLNGKGQSQDLEHVSRKTSVDGGPGTVQSGQKLTVGSRGPEVEEFQKQLNAWRSTKGLPPITVDGIFGNQSAEAVRQFQLATGLSTDGIAGPNTKTQLQKELNSNT
jgi:hypothetical protein